MTRAITATALIGDNYSGECASAMPASTVDKLICTTLIYDTHLLANARRRFEQRLPKLAVAELTIKAYPAGRRPNP